MARLVYPARSRHTQPGHAIPSQATSYPSQATPYPARPRHTQARPRHTQARPRHTQARPSHTQARPRHTQARPRHTQARPRHAHAQNHQNAPLPDSGDLAGKKQYLLVGGPILLRNGLISRRVYIVGVWAPGYGPPWPWGLGIWQKATTGSWAPQNWGPKLGPKIGPTIRPQNWAHNLGPRAQIPGPWAQKCAHGPIL